MSRRLALLGILALLCTSAYAVSKDAVHEKRRQQAPPAKQQAPVLLETRGIRDGLGAAAQAVAQGGGIKDGLKAGLATVAGQMVGKVLKGRVPYQPRPYGIGSPQLNGAAGRLSYDDAQCVMCQYIVQRINSEMIMNGIGQITPGQSPQDALAQESQAWADSMTSTMQFATPPVAPTDAAAQPSPHHAAAAAASAAAGPHGTPSLLETRSTVTHDDQEDHVDNGEPAVIDPAATADDRDDDLNQEQREDDNEPISLLEVEFVDNEDFVLVETGAEARAQARAAVRAQRAAAAREVIRRFRAGAGVEAEVGRRGDHHDGLLGGIDQAIDQDVNAVTRPVEELVKDVARPVEHLVKDATRPLEHLINAGHEVLFGDDVRFDKDGLPLGHVKPLTPKQMKKLGTDRPPFQAPPTRAPPFVPHPVDEREVRTQKAWKTKRERFDDFWEWQPTTHRYSTLYDLPGKAVQRAKERFEEQQIEGVVYKVVENICTRHMPKAYYAICGGLMRRFRKIARLLQWKNRPEATCMHINFCNIKSYVQTNPHSTFN